MTNVIEVLKLNSIHLKKKDGDTDGPLKDIKLLSLYFSAHWCPPCRNFTPKLASCYEEVNSAEKRWEIVFVSCDKNESAFSDYFATMPWLSLPYENEDKDALMKEHGVRGIPALVNIDPVSGTVITKDGRTSVEKDPKGVDFPWTG